MFAMPLSNYEDLPRSRVMVWCDFFVSLPSFNDRATVFQQMWGVLTPEEQNDVLKDLHMLMQSSSPEDFATSNHSSAKSSIDDDDIDFSYRNKL
jgi:hypothetical protein